MLFFGVIFLLAIAAFALCIVQDRRRGKELHALARELGLSFDPQRSRQVARRYDHVPQMKRGSDRYGQNFLGGSYRGHEVAVFEFHYAVQRGSGKNQHTDHEFLQVFVVTLPGCFPRLTIAPEGLFSKLAQSLGYEDIDFESHEFSRRFCVRSADKKFAYDFCHARMIEYLLGQDEMVLHLEGEELLLLFEERLAVHEFRANLERLAALRGLFPGYLAAPL